MPTSTRIPQFLVSVSQEMSVRSRRLCAVLKDMSQYCQKLHQQGLVAADVTAVNSILLKMFVSIERLSQLKEYRTPQGLRSMARFYVVVILPLFYGPLWARVKMDMGFTFALFLALMMNLVLTGLLNLAISLEDPFDEVALDGVSIYEASDHVLWAVHDPEPLDSPPHLSLSVRPQDKDKGNSALQSKGGNGATRETLGSSIV
ncbi:unnamed protein product [Ostreobium quekettii]|uniref:Uncharacterized protein n=1 Tax=Ostreobium quekettii TaxID=121088 RepID=A0A8S1JBB2_9CHLO|nr:unnamed protein product [Ostreobium quekettii]|eukprot:evm.model.scf_385.5 EVM.evm.TU.scf_385.5   scf_385:42624-44483(+)